MEFKDIIITTLISALICGIMITALPSPKLGDSMIEPNQTDFQNGIKAGGTVFITGARALTVSSITNTGASANTGAVSGAGATFTGLDVNLAATGTIEFGATTTPACAVYGDSDGAGVTWCTYLNGSQTCTSTKPATCSQPD